MATGAYRRRPRTQRRTIFFPPRHKNLGRSGRCRRRSGGARGHCPDIAAADDEEGGLGCAGRRGGAREHGSSAHWIRRPVGDAGRIRDVGACRAREARRDDTVLPGRRHFSFWRFSMRGHRPALVSGPRRQPARGYAGDLAAGAAGGRPWHRHGRARRATIAP